MTHEQSMHAQMAGPGAPFSTPRPRWVLPVAALAVAGTVVAIVALRRTDDAVGGTEAPFTVSGSRVDVRDQAPTWSYLEFAQAGEQAPVDPAPVPARVGFDEPLAAPLVAPLTGRVDAVAVRLGQRVAKGDRLVAIRSADLVDLTKEVELKRSEETGRAKSVERLRALVDLHAEPTKKLIDAQQDLAQATLAREAAELKLRSLSVAQDDAGLYWLLAPRDGVVVQRDVLAGQVVGPERPEPLLVVAELDEVVVTADVPESDVAGLAVGETARVLPTGTSDNTGLTGRIEYIREVVDPQRRMVEVRVRVPNTDHALRPNAFVQVAFVPADVPRIVVPAEAVVTDDQQSFVFVRDGTHLDRREVALGRQGGGRAEILHGLAAGETYVTKGAILLLNAVDLATQ